MILENVSASIFRRNWPEVCNSPLKDKIEQAKAAQSLPHGQKIKAEEEMETALKACREEWPYQVDVDRNTWKRGIPLGAGCLGRSWGTFCLGSAKCQAAWRLDSRRTTMMDCLLDAEGVRPKGDGNDYEWKESPLSERTFLNPYNGNNEEEIGWTLCHCA